MTIGFVTKHNVASMTDRSGVPFFIVQSLRKLGHEVNVIIISDQRNFWERIMSRLLHFWFNIIWNGNRGFYTAEYTEAMWRSYSRCIMRSELLKLDLLLGIDLLVFTKVKSFIPMVVWTDNIIRTYSKNPKVGRVCNLLQSSIDKAEKEVISKLRTLYVASGWLREIVKDSYNIDSKKIKVLPRGAGILESPSHLQVLELIKIKKEESEFKVLFICSNWEGKNGNRILEIARMLKDVKKITWTIAGKIGENKIDQINELGIKYVGYLDKNSPIGYDMFTSLLMQASLLVILSPAEGFGITYTEAAKFGVPSIGLNVMGVTEAIKDEVTGILLPSDVSDENAANQILSIFENEVLWENLCNSAWYYSQENFDWVKNLKKLLDDNIINSQNNYK